MSTRPCFIGGEPIFGRTIAGEDVSTGDTLDHVTQAEPDDIERGIAMAWAARGAFRAWPAYKRRDALMHVAKRIGERFDEFAETISAESGKTIREARGEVARAIDTFTIAAEEATRIRGETTPLDVSPRGDGLRSISMRVPVGVCGFITPFNFPFNLVAHKVAPALACGCPFILKPAPQTPLSALNIGELLAETDLPPGVFTIAPCTVSAAGPIVKDDRIALLSFTGSAAVGWKLKAEAGRKRVVLELGGNAACIVDRGVDIGRAADRITFGAFGQAGQSCISVQRVLCHREVVDDLRSALVERAERLVCGDPIDERTDIGPLIDEANAARVEQWIRDALDAGATLVTGGDCEGATVMPTIVENVQRDAALSCEEVFAPVMTLETVDTMDEAIAIANDSDYGLQAGIFTKDIDVAFRAFDRLEVGAVVVNDVPTVRVDSMPYGGVKGSGLGREGVRSAIEAMTEQRLLVVRSA